MTSLVPRKNDLTEEIELSSGNYVAGTDLRRVFMTSY